MSEGGRTPPHDIVAEQSIAGAMLLDSRCVPLVMGLLRREDYYQRAHTLIHDAIHHNSVT